MKHLKLFENHSKNEKIKEILEDHYLYLIDDGYRPSFSHNHDWSITVFNLFKNKIDFDFDSQNWIKILQSNTQQVASIQKRLLNFKVENIISLVKFHVYTYYNYPAGKSTLDPGLIEYSSILNGDINLRDIKSKLTELENLKVEIEENVPIPKPIKWYFDIQILSEIDYGLKDALDVLF